MTFVYFMTKKAGEFKLHHMLIHLNLSKQLLNERKTVFYFSNDYKEVIDYAIKSKNVFVLSQWSEHNKEYFPVWLSVDGLRQYTLIILLH